MDVSEASIGSVDGLTVAGALDIYNAELEYSNLKISPDNYDTTFELGNGDNNLNVSGSLTVTGNVVAEESVRSEKMFLVGMNQSNTWSPDGDVTIQGKLAVGGDISTQSGNISTQKGDISTQSGIVSTHYGYLQAWDPSTYVLKTAFGDLTKAMMPRFETVMFEQME